MFLQSLRITLAIWDRFDKNTGLFFPLNYQNEVSSCKDNDLHDQDLRKANKKKILWLKCGWIFYCDIQQASQALGKNFMRTFSLYKQEVT